MRRILCYGDSNTWGFQPAKPFQRFPKTVRWTGVLASLLGSDFEIIEEGLNGRTTIWDDPFGEHKNGKTYLPPCLESHAVLDLVIITLGTNDLKAHFDLSASDVAQGLKVLASIVKSSNAGMNGSAPELLLVAPPPIEKLSLLAGVYEGGPEKSRELVNQIDLMSQFHGHRYFDAGSIITSSQVDGIHWDEEQHQAFAQAISHRVLEILC